MNTPSMRAKVKVTKAEVNDQGEELHFVPVCKNETYPADGSDENNTYARFSPSGFFRLSVRNPVLFGQFKEGDEFYVDFTKAEAQS